MDVLDGDYLMTDSEWDELVWVWGQSDVPRGCRVEIIEGLVTVTPYSAQAHHGTIERLHRRLYEGLPEDWGVYQRLALAVPPRLGLYVPDAAVVPKDALLMTDPGLVDAGRAELVVEVTSRATARHDRVNKPAAYASAGIPLYLLVDRWAPEGPTATLYGEPRGDVYRPLAIAKFGELLTIPAPFDLVIDTGEFPES
ncbi:Uma2 family endonuclease [Streptomyces griseorubiginosus]|uniref:Uma2 family endonuclease n=1 Tax=Streptomyces griseorubiginosus TaxID=67304 RepID=UPI00076CB9B2|nr:Uma2 family endonuclease [Streptomyces griseorubiginosus]KUM77954.1 restriction endonuclease [Streptomyces griseorubiginosus]